VRGGGVWESKSFSEIFGSPSPCERGDKKKGGFLRSIIIWGDEFRQSDGKAPLFRPDHGGLIKALSPGEKKGGLTLERGGGRLEKRLASQTAR